MTTKERFLRAFRHEEADRVPITDSPWNGTLARWRREGMPANADWREYFGADKVETIGVDVSPRYPEKILEETDRYVISTSPWGVTMKQFKHEDSTPEFLDYKVTTPEAWAEAKSRMQPDRSRIPWEQLQKEYPRWQAEGRWIQAGFWFGFDVTHSWMAGTETILIAMMEEPEWVRDMFDTYLDMCIAHFDMLWDAGYTFDAIYWPDDMGYKGTTFFSPRLYRELLQPVHARAVHWAHQKGIYANLHSCGDVMSLMDDILVTGVDALNPLEVKAGMDSLLLKQKYGDRLVLQGGINAVLWDQKDAIIAEIERLVPALKQGGGYIFSSDHSIPNSVSAENFRAILDTVKRVGRY